MLTMRPADKLGDLQCAMSLLFTGLETAIILFIEVKY